MFGEATITLNQIANGWLVNLPYQPEIQPSVDEILGFNEQAVRKFTSIQMDELNKDHVLERLKGEEDPQKFEIPKPKPQPLNTLKNDRLHFFKTYKEALKFIDKQLSQ